MSKEVYDHIAEAYRDSKLLPFRDFIESYTLFCLLGDPSGKSILDLACGEGHYTRRVKRAGASQVVGVDVSARMIELANDAEKAAPLGCRYVVGDVQNLDLHEQFDVIIGAYLLNYASSKEILLNMCRVVFAHLKPGGQFIGFNDYVGNAPESYGKYAKYGFVKTTTEKRQEGDTITYHITNPDGSQFQFDNFFLHPATYSACFAEAGLQSFAWQGPWLSPMGEQTFPSGFWDVMLNDPPFIGFSAEKPRSLNESPFDAHTRPAPGASDR
jgi:ubiquinone/menaquinone biosynthesis C-methylase UbiE